jgi:hypothetical protein
MNDTIIKSNEQTDIRARYLNGESLHRIMKDYPYSWDTGKRFLISNGVSVKGHYRYNHQCFSKLTEQSLYFSGLITADGCITYQNGHPNIYLSSKDQDIIDKFLEFVGAPNKSIYTSKTGCHTVSIRSRPMTKSLIDWGIVPRKSTIDFEIAEELVFSRHFWRGMIDGDGHIGYTKNKFPIVYLSSSNRNILKQFITFLKCHGLYFGNKIFKYKDKNFYLYKQVSHNATRIIFWLYSYANIYINRKMDMAEELMRKGVLG